MNELYFVTGNASKFKEVKHWLSELNPYIDLRQADIDLPEIQSLDVQEVAMQKAKEAWRLIKKPLLIDDGGIYIERYNNFPGTLSKYVYQGIGLDGFWLLAKDNPRGSFANCLVYCSSEHDYQIFNGVSTGTIVEPTEPIVDTKFPFTYVFIPDGTNKTFAQLKGSEEEKKFHHRYKSLQEFTQWLKNNA